MVLYSLTPHIPRRILPGNRSGFTSRWCTRRYHASAELTMVISTIEVDLPFLKDFTSPSLAWTTPNGVKASNRLRPKAFASLLPQSSSQTLNSAVSHLLEYTSCTHIGRLFFASHRNPLAVWLGVHCMVSRSHIHIAALLVKSEQRCNDRGLFEYLVFTLQRRLTSYVQSIYHFR